LTFCLAYHSKRTMAYHTIQNKPYHSKRTMACQTKRQNKSEKVTSCFLFASINLTEENQKHIIMQLLQFEHKQRSKQEHTKSACQSKASYYYLGKSKICIICLMGLSIIRAYGTDYERRECVGPL